jgi:serine/threonine protein kinase
MRIGPYEIVSTLGQGGMGVVFGGRSPEGRPVAIKVLKKNEAEVVVRFERERRLLASLGEAEGFVPLLGTGASEHGPYLVMPLIPGGTLRRKLEAGPLGIEETVALGRRLSLALGAAHARGIVHRDLKPENVLFTEAGLPIARRHRGDLDGAIADLTRAIEIKPSDARFWLDRGIARSSKGNIAGAIDDYERFLALAPTDPRTAEFRGELERLRRLRDGQPARAP